jgi:hypothetical protein
VSSGRPRQHRATAALKSGYHRQHRATTRLGIVGRMTTGQTGNARRLGYESPAEAAIREAMERGEFDNLPGAGKPLPDHGRDENWWLTQYLNREEGSSSGFLPQSLLLRREAQDLPDRAARTASEVKVRDLVADLNRRISDEIRMPTGGPPLAMRLLDADEIVARWRSDRAELAPPRPTDQTVTAHRPAARQSFWRRLFRSPSD